MALVKCKECAKEISSEAEACPNCGRKKPKPTSGLTWVIAGIFGFAIISTMMNSGKTDEEKAARLAAMTPEQRATEAKDKADSEDLSSARYACKEFVKRTLNDPDAAQFDETSTYDSKREGGDLFHVQVKVRAKNGFNALRYITVDCKTIHANDKWLPVSVKELT
ncbi:MAG: hypothetical protein ABI145_15390 [Steroidobacteraceae bacterium]